MSVVKTAEISSQQASDVQSRVYQIQNEVSNIISRLSLRHAEELLQYCREFLAMKS